MATLDARPDLSFVSHWLQTFGDEQWEWTPLRNDLGILLDYNVLNGAAMFRRTLVGDVGGFDESMREGCEDWEFWIRGHRARPSGNHSAGAVFTHTGGGRTR